jgi:peptide chain release factor 2
MEAQSQTPGFWDDNIAAQKVMREINTRKEWVDEWRKANGQAEDVSTLVELAEESSDDAMEGELQSELGRLNETVEAL